MGELTREAFEAGFTDALEGVEKRADQRWASVRSQLFDRRRNIPLVDPGDEGDLGYFGYENVHDHQKTYGKKWSSKRSWAAVRRRLGQAAANPKPTLTWDDLYTLQEKGGLR